MSTIDLVCVISDLSGGGTQRVLWHLVNYWVSRGKYISLITFSDKNQGCYVFPSVVRHDVIGGFLKSRNKFIGILANFGRIINLRKQLKKLNSPVVLSFLANTNIITILATIGMRTRVVISERNDPVHQSFGIVWDWLRRQCYRYADVVTANSRPALQTLMTFVPEGKCRLVSNPIYPKPMIKKINLHAPTILAAGRLHYQKAYDLLLQAFSQFSHVNPKWQLMILGEGPLKNNLQQQAKEWNIYSKVKWLGYVNDPFPYYCASDIFVMPSRYEGMPNALLEAMSCELPVIISDALVGPLEIIENEKNGIVFPAENVDALVKSLNKLALDPAFCRMLSQNAKEAVKSYYIENVISEWDFVFSV